MLAANKVLGTRVLVANEVRDNGGGDGSSDRLKHVKPKTERSKSQKLAKSQKSSKSGKSKGKKSKKPSKGENLPNFNAKDSRPSFLTPKARSAFNRLQLAFTKAPILQYFNPECHIWIKTDVSDFAIGGMLSQLASRTSLDGIVTKTDLG